jgi:gamma-glutamyl:cysteine ligase YbdK (ATP-grasp superfamily)
MNPSDERLGIFSAFGVEIEYMIVDEAGLRALPVSDVALQRAAGQRVADFDAGELAWSNELVLHVIELKTNGPVPTLEGLPALFQRDVHRIDGLLDSLGGRLLPSAMHPLFDPATETKLWPHDSREIYEAFDRIFGCSGHGWSNLQSTHLNLPFANDEEFGRLHAAIRLVLPLIPAVAASSPFVEGRATGLCDNRLDHYRTNCRRLPCITGAIVPEPVFTERDYERRILDVIAKEVAPLDPESVLEPIWVNARGAIARFDRGSIEIRLLDVQECPLADLALVALLVAVARGLAEERWCSFEEQRAASTERLAAILVESIRHGSLVEVPADYAKYLGLGRGGTGRSVLASVVDRLVAQGLLDASPWGRPLEVIASRGSLAERLVAAASPDVTEARLLGVYRELGECLRTGQLFG